MTQNTPLQWYGEEETYCSFMRGYFQDPISPIHPKLKSKTVIKYETPKYKVQVQKLSTKK